MPGGTPYDGLYGEAPPKILGYLFPCCWMLLRVVAQSLKPVKLFSQQLPTFLLFRDRRSVCTALPTLLGPRTFIIHGLQRFIGCILPTMHCRSQHWWDCVASVCTPLPTCTQQLPTLLAQQWQQRANELSFELFAVHKHGGDDVTWKPPIF